MAEITFQLNGQTTTVSYDEGMHFLEVLREYCGVTSVKDGCAPQGVCGCCTILLDGKPSLACQLNPAKADGSEVVTLEGLPERQRQLLAGAFVREGAVQCGFCTPGMIMATKAFLEENPDPSDEEIKKALAGHLCRCTGYVQIIEAVRAAAKEMIRG